MRLIIDKVGLRNYEDVDGIKGKVLINHEFLKEIAENNHVVRMKDNHNGKIIGKMKDFRFADDALSCEVITEYSVDGKGFSPAWKFDLAKTDNGLVAVNPKDFDHVALVDNPRNGLIYNSKPKLNNDTDLNDNNIMSDNMVNDNKNELEELRTKNYELNKANLELERKNTENEIKLAKFDELEKNNAENLVEIAKLKEDVETFKEKSEKYDKIDEKDRIEAMKSYFGKKDDEELTEQEIQLCDGLDSTRIRKLHENRKVNENFEGGGQKGSPSGNNSDEDEFPSSVEEWKKQRNY
ncbi:MAG: hypothetical protein LBU40_04125 [Methanobrevibacter sp.]|jgi:hypothetical protein|nr:hypothetical protein [Methanobrevibacter sp.]